MYFVHISDMGGFITRSYLTIDAFDQKAEYTPELLHLHGWGLGVAAADPRRCQLPRRGGGRAPGRGLAARRYGRGLHGPHRDLHVQPGATELEPRT